MGARAPASTGCSDIFSGTTMNYTLPFYKLCPGGNPTVLLHDDGLFAVPSTTRAAIARTLLDGDHLGADQVGFLDISRGIPHMEMMGGEFCANATRSAAAVFAKTGLLPAANGGWEGSITTSGIDGAVAVRVREEIPGMAYDAAISLKLSEKASLFDDIDTGEVLVRLPGITHLLLDCRAHPLPVDLFAAVTKKRFERGLETCEAVGVIWHERCPENAKTRRITPVVHVAATDSSIQETACGSGSLALALHLARSSEEREFVIRQPSGKDITVSFTPDGMAWVGGSVQLTAQGMTYVSL